jgi:hypothetical protein
MDADSRIVLERLRQGGLTRIGEIAAGVRPPVSAEQRMGLAFAPGDRVFDTVSGQEGTVHHAVSRTPGAVVLFSVDLDAGSAVVRIAEELLARPTPPVPDSGR